MKTGLLFFSLAAFSWAQVEKPVAPKSLQQPQQQVKRLAAVTWDLSKHKLVWVVEKGAEINGEFVPASSDSYEVAPDEGFMSAKDQKLGIAEDEAVSLRRLLDILSMYCAESVVWWEKTVGVPDSPNDKTRDKADPPQKPTRVGQQEPKPDPHHPVPGRLVAADGAH